jgi:hypothetical protein
MREREEKKAARKDGMLQYVSGDMDTAHLKSEYTLLQKKYNRLEAKEKQLQKLCADWESKSTDNYEEFFKSVNLIVNSTNSKFKATAGVITMVCIKNFIFIF